MSVESFVPRAAYRLSLGEQPWLQGLAEAWHATLRPTCGVLTFLLDGHATPRFQAGHGAPAMVLDAAACLPTPRLQARHGAPALLLDTPCLPTPRLQAWHGAPAMVLDAAPSLLRRALARYPRAGSIGTLGPGEDGLDARCIQAGPVLVLAPSRQPLRPNVERALVWMRLAAHVAGAWWLRCPWSAEPRTGEPEVDLWFSLLAGTWGVVDVCEPGALRCLVARQVEGDRAGLTGRERQMALLASLGWTNEAMGQELGLSRSTVASQLGSALARLRLGRRHLLVELLAATLRAEGAGSPRVSSFVEGGVAHRALWYARDVSTAPGLTGVERNICRQLLGGLSSEDIARERGRSVRTVENQVASIFRKLGVRSRRELLLRGAPGAP